MNSMNGAMLVHCTKATTFSHLVFILVFAVLLSGCAFPYKRAVHQNVIEPQFKITTIPKYRIAIRPDLTMEAAVTRIADASVSNYQRYRLSTNLAEQLHHYAKIQDNESYSRLKEALTNNYDPALFGNIEDVLTGKFLDDIDRVTDLIDRIIDAAHAAGIGNGIGGFGDIDFGSVGIDAGPSPVKKAVQHNIDSFDDTPPNKSMDTDTDGDGIPDYSDIDNDGDGYSDAWEKKEGTDPDDDDDHPSGKKDVKDNEWDEDEDEDGKDDFYPGPGCPGGPVQCFGGLLDAIYDVRGLINGLTGTYLNITYDIDQVIDTLPELGTVESRQNVIWIYKLQ